ncbi:hypothetical protein PSPO01_16197 [Paraphaeosphaeria sporulosa]
MVPPAGAGIADVDVLPVAIVSTGITFVHYNGNIFPSPDTFNPEPWLDFGAVERDQWLFVFSGGPRMCLEINLEWAELRLGFAHVYHKSYLRAAKPLQPTLNFREIFLPYHYDAGLKVLHFRKLASMAQDPSEHIWVRTDQAALQHKQVYAAESLPRDIGQPPALSSRVRWY